MQRLRFIRVCLHDKDELSSSSSFVVAHQFNNHLIWRFSQRLTQTVHSLSLINVGVKLHEYVWNSEATTPCCVVYELRTSCQIIENHPIPSLIILVTDFNKDAEQYTITLWMVNHSILTCRWFLHLITDISGMLIVNFSQIKCLSKYDALPPKIFLVWCVNEPRQINFSNVAVNFGSQTETTV